MSSSASAAALKQEVQKHVLSFLEKGGFDEAHACVIKPVLGTVQAKTARQKFLLDSGASHMVRWMDDHMQPQAQGMEEVKLQLAVGEVSGWMHRGGDTVFLDRAQEDNQQLDEMAELLPLGRLCRDYNLTFIFDGISGSSTRAQERV